MERNYEEQPLTNEERLKTEETTADLTSETEKEQEEEEFQKEIETQFPLSGGEA
ncbi:MAG: hypothetical protein H7257_00850 [Taibaiella sp.]|nr:hypothetical protein [Taibaiella sp.]